MGRARHVVRRLRLAQQQVSSQSYEITAWTNPPSSGITTGNNAGANDELFSFHPGGVNVLMGDGSVRFLKDTVNIVTLRGLVTPKGGEVISADQY